MQTKSARLHAQVNPNGAATAYRFDYITKAAYEANLSQAKDGFDGTSRIPLKIDAPIGSGSSPVTILQILSGLASDTVYRYRLVATSSEGTTEGPIQTLITEAPVAVLLADGRGWEMVSPIDKNGGQVDAPGAIAAGGVLQAAADGQSVSYGSTSSFGEDPDGAPPASQYLASRVAEGWLTENITAPMVAGSFADDAGVPYRIFSTDLSRGLLLNGDHCRGEGGGCAVPNPPLAGTDAPAGYQNYYLRQGGGFEALLGAADVTTLKLAAKDFDLLLAGTSPDLSHVVMASCAALTANATEIPLGDGCDSTEPNLYRWSSGALSLINILPAQSQGTPGATLGAQRGAVSLDGSRVYWSNGTNLYLREGSVTKQVDTAAGGGGSFQVASSDGSLAYFTKAGHLYLYETATEAATDLTPGGEVSGVLGASADGDEVYYLTAAGLFLRDGANVTPVADAADASNYQPTPATGTARVSANGSHLLFMATASLTGYDNTDLNSGDPTSQVYLYDADADELRCVSCNPTNERPIGASSIPGAIANGKGATATVAYKPRTLSSDGSRVFFDTSDALIGPDTNDAPDVYQWEAAGTGSCTRPEGCISLASSGKDKGVSFVDASASGDDVFFLTSGSLIKADPGGVDLYDARVGGGFSVPPPPLACIGDACQPLPARPVTPTLTTLLSGPGNPSIRYTTRCRKGKVKRKGRCVNPKRNRNAKRRAGGSR